MNSVLNIGILFMLVLINNCTGKSQSNKKQPVTIKKKLTAHTSKLVPEKINEIALPDGFKRIPAKANSFAAYLQNLKLKKDKTVYAYNGSIVMNSKNGYQYAVIDIDIGNRDLQQCADAVIRLRAEYLYRQKKYKDIHFNFSDRKAHYFTNFSKTDPSYKKFRKYMNYIFAYANTATLKKELHKISLNDMQAGDVFIQQGSPYGHAVIVVDMAENSTSGEKIFMVAQSFMPAQSIHILKNLSKNNSPWYSLNFGNELNLPCWTFMEDDLRRF